jgi:SPOR domain
MRRCIVAVLLAATSVSWSQTDDQITKLVVLVEQGHSDQVKGELERLQKSSPNDPGVMYLQALLMTDGSEAVRMYQSIVDNFPRSQWADDALFKVYQFYYSLGLYRTADLKMAQLRKEYPTSRYISQAAVDDTTAQADEQDVPAGAVSDSVNSEGPPITEVPSGGFTLQVGAYSTQVNAEKQKVFFEDMNLPVEVINRVKEGASLYIVLVGNFATADDARAKGAEIKKSYNIDSMVIQR